jgi:hypothetical protein
MKVTITTPRLLSSSRLQLWCPLLLLSFPAAKELVLVMATVRFEDSAVIKCTGFETMAEDELPAGLPNCFAAADDTTFGEDSQSLWGCKHVRGCEEQAINETDTINVFSMYWDCEYEQSGKVVSTLRYVFFTPPQCTNGTAAYIECADNCSGKSGQKGISATPETSSSAPMELFCPAAATTTDDANNTKFSSCTTVGTAYTDEIYTSNFTNSSGTYISIIHPDVSLVCDEECSNIPSGSIGSGNVSGSDSGSSTYRGTRNALRFSAVLCFVLSTCVVVAG